MASRAKQPEKPKRPQAKVLTFRQMLALFGIALAFFGTGYYVGLQTRAARPVTIIASPAADVTRGDARDIVDALEEEEDRIVGRMR